MRGAWKTREKYSRPSTTDFESFQRHGIIFCPANKDVIVFPEKIGGHYVAFHRPNPNAHLAQPEIWLARSPDLLHCGQHERLLGTEAGWATMKVGGGTRPIRTPRGWLLLYHGHSGSSSEASKRGDIGSYASATLLQALDDRCGSSREPVMLAEADFDAAVTWRTSAFRPRCSGEARKWTFTMPRPIRRHVSRAMR